MLRFFLCALLIILTSAQLRPRSCLRRCGRSIPRVSPPVVVRGLCQRAAVAAPPYQKFCQCDSRCRRFCDCCSDYGAFCITSSPTVSPTRSPTTSPTSSPSVCFSALATVEVYEQGEYHKTSLQDLRIGSKVKCIDGATVKNCLVKTNVHYVNESSIMMAACFNDDCRDSVVMSPDHMICRLTKPLPEPRFCTFVPINSLKTGDPVLRTNPDGFYIANLVRLDKKVAPGAAVPFAGSGILVVDGVVSSEYVAWKCSDAQSCQDFMFYINKFAWRHAPEGDRRRLSDFPSWDPMIAPIAAHSDALVLAGCRFNQTSFIDEAKQSAFEDWTPDVVNTLLSKHAVCAGK